MDALGNVTSMTVAPSSSAPTATSYQASYDTGHRLVSLTSYGGAIPPLHSYSYAYDQHNNRTAITADGTTTSYSYDAYNQLLSSQVGTATPTTYEYDANHNRLKMTTAAGTTQYTYDDSNTRLVSLTDPNNKVTTFSYDHGQPNEVGNLWQKVYDPSGADQVTTYGYDTNNRLNYVSLPNGTVVAFTFDANGNRTQKSVTPQGGSTTVTNDTYQNGLLQYETTGGGTLLAIFTYDGQGVPVSVRVGSDPNTSLIYYYVYNGHGDVDALVDGSGTVVASYTYDDWGAITASSENFPNGWTNPYRYDGHDRVHNCQHDSMPPTALLLQLACLRGGPSDRAGAHRPPRSARPCHATCRRQGGPLRGAPPSLRPFESAGLRRDLDGGLRSRGLMVGEPGGASRADQEAHTAATRAPTAGATRRGSTAGESLNCPTEQE